MSTWTIPLVAFLLCSVIALFTWGDALRRIRLRQEGLLGPRTWEDTLLLIVIMGANIGGGWALLQLLSLLWR